jgi:predicted nucleic acid-binding protein
MSAPAGMPGDPGRFVVDASVAIKWFVPEIHAGAARRLLREGVTLLAPDLIWAEVANALWRKWREKELAAELVEGILNDFRRYPLRIHSAESLYEVTWPVAQESGRTFYGSLYLALAISQGCSMVTAHHGGGTAWG